MAKVERPRVVGDRPMRVMPSFYKQRAFVQAPSILRFEPPGDLRDCMPKQAEGLFAAKSNEEIIRQLGLLLEEIDFDTFVIGMYSKERTESDGIPTASVLGKVAPSWLKRYDEAGYLDVDPRVEHCLQSPTLYTWDRAQKTTADAAIMFEEAAVFGIRAGISCPILTHDGFVGMFSASTSYDLSRSDLMSPHVRGRFLILRDYLSMLISPDTAQPIEEPGTLLFDRNAKLSRREEQVLLAASLGLSVVEISDKLHISESTTRLYLSTAKARLGARKLGQAIAVAVKHNLIPFPDHSAGSPVEVRTVPSGEVRE